MNKETVLASLTPEIVDKFRVAIEIGKWPDAVSYTHLTLPTILRV